MAIDSIHLQGDSVHFGQDSAHSALVDDLMEIAKVAREEMACNLTKSDGQGEDVFLCFAYQPDSPNIDRKAVLRRLCQRSEGECTEEDLDELSEDDRKP